MSNIEVCVVGLGYVGLPLACLFSKHYDTVGYDCNSQRIDDLRRGKDSTCEVVGHGLEDALGNGLMFTSDISVLAENRNNRKRVFIVAVPTPVDENMHPDLVPLSEASRTVGGVLGNGDVVVYESTVYPGVTEEVCVPILAETSGLVYNNGFYVGYSPERVNPGDKEHAIETICKVTSGSTPETADFVDALYSSVLVGGTHRAPSIRVAEASKIVENCQRDVNIAFVNELAKIFAAMGLDTGDILDAAASKWNFIRMKPGLVGGHCIGVDPYYMIEKAQVYGVFPRVMYSARRLNDGMGAYVAGRLIHLMNLAGRPVKDASLLILGFTFKENCPDIRNTKVADVYNTLSEYTGNITVYDPWADPEKVYKEYGVVINNSKSAIIDKEYDAAILAVAHCQFADINIRDLVPRPGIVYDVKGFLPRSDVDGRL
ncbi:MAG: nucleotide sugar dehydrogenase [Bacteroidales bacterium]|nr:nucleotide sugar dehydrogenase [Bacteroidales bacterium]